MPNNKADRVLFAYFERSLKEYARTVESVKASGGLSEQEIGEIRQQVPSVHADAIFRHLDVVEHSN